MTSTVLTGSSNAIAELVNSLSLEHMLQGESINDWVAAVAEVPDAGPLSDRFGALLKNFERLQDANNVNAFAVRVLAAHNAAAGEQPLVASFVDALPLEALDRAPQAIGRAFAHLSQNVLPELRNLRDTAELFVERESPAAAWELLEILATASDEILRNAAPLFELSGNLSSNPDAYVAQLERVGTEVLRSHFAALNEVREELLAQREHSVLTGTKLAEAVLSGARPSPEFIAIAMRLLIIAIAAFVVNQLNQTLASLESLDALHNAYTARNIQLDVSRTLNSLPISQTGDGSDVPVDKLYSIGYRRVERGWLGLYYVGVAPLFAAQRQYYHDVLFGRPNQIVSYGSTTLSAAIVFIFLSLVKRGFYALRAQNKLAAASDPNKRRLTGSVQVLPEQTTLAVVSTNPFKLGMVATEAANTIGGPVFMRPDAAPAPAAAATTAVVKTEPPAERPRRPAPINTRLPVAPASRGALPLPPRVPIGTGPEASAALAFANAEAARLASAREECRATGSGSDCETIIPVSVPPANPIGPRRSRLSETQ